MLEQFTSDRFARQAGVRSIGAIAADFVARVLEAERRFVSAGWHEPVGLNDAGFRVGLRVGQFGDVGLGCVYRYLCEVAERGSIPAMAECMDAAECWGVTLEPYVRGERLTPDWLPCLIRETEFDQAENLDRYAADVVRLVETRERSASKHLHAIGELLIDANDYEFLIRRKGAPIGPATSTRRKVARYA